jgi:Mn-dependent DtxR family transcriptional regulator
MKLTKEQARKVKLAENFLVKHKGYTRKRAEKTPVALKTLIWDMERRIRTRK